MKDYPNEEALRKAHRIYLDAMRGFIHRCLKKVLGTTPTELIMRALDCELGDDIEVEIEVNNIPHLIREHWDNCFRREFDRHYDARSAAGKIKDGRNFWAHPGIEDVDSESTRMHLSLVAEALGEINKPEAKEAVETIRDQLFSDEVEEHPVEVENAALKENLADMTKQLDAAQAEKTELEKQVKTTSDRLEEVEAEWIACDERLAAMSDQLATTSNRLKDVEKENAAYQKRVETISDQLETEKTKYEKVLKAASNQLATLKREKTQLEARLETTSTQLEDVKKELADFEAEVEEPTKKEPDPIPATEFPYTGSQLRDFRKKAGLTQVAVAVELGMKRSSSSAIGDWEAEREKVPRKHYTKLKELYGLDDEKVFPRSPTNTTKSPRYQRKWRQPGAVAALRDPAEIRKAEAQIAKILNPSEKARLERELLKAKRSVDSS